MFKRIINALKKLFCRTQHANKRSGTIKFFDRKKRFGFIISGKDEFFFHAAGTRPKDFKFLKDGLAVTFDVVEGKKGPQADKIEII